MNFLILAYYLARKGYNVFLANVRGNYYSSTNTKPGFGPESEGFYDFSWDTMGYRDIPAIIDYVRDFTGTDRVYIIAHSQGTSAMMALLSNTDLEIYNDRIHAVVLLSPVGYMGSATRHIATLLGKTRSDKKVKIVQMK